MRKLGLLKTENQAYKIKIQEDGTRLANAEIRVPIKIYEKSSSGGWDHLETIDGEKLGADKNLAHTDRKTNTQAWDDAVDTIRFYDESDIIETKKRF